MTREEAIAELEQIQTKITPETFQAMAQERSDCGSFAQGGDLGMFGPGQMMASFEEASFALKVNLALLLSKRIATLKTLDPFSPSRSFAGRVRRWERSVASLRRTQEPI